jgi:Transketolase, pyrimidine binding domain
MSVTDSAARPDAGAPAGRRLTTARAIAEGIAQEMERDSGVVVLGEDVGKYGGIFGATGGLLDQFGPERVMDTPISETAFIGLGVGAALSRGKAGTRPWSPSPSRSTMPWTWQHRCRRNTAWNSRSSTCAAWFRWTARPSSVPIPYARTLEQAVLPGSDRIRAAARELLGV